jgi:hypothetical protein
MGMPGMSCTNETGDKENDSERVLGGIVESVNLSTNRILTGGGAQNRKNYV